MRDITEIFEVDEITLRSGYVVQDEDVQYFKDRIEHFEQLRDKTINQLVEKSTMTLIC